MPKISARNLEEHRAETLDRLLDSWGDLVMERGYAGVSLADVASAAGIARTAIYNYFSDREELLMAWTDREVRRTVAATERDVREAETCAGKLRVFVRHQLATFTARHLPPGKEAVQFIKPETYRRFMAHIEPVEAILRRILEEGAAGGELADLDVDATVPLVMACIGSERVPLATGAHDIDDATERVTSFVLRALSAPEPPAR